MRNLSLVSILLATTVTLASLVGTTATTGCGGGGSGAGGDAPVCFDYAKFDGTMPEEVFTADKGVLFVFQRSCGVADTCHGGADPSMLPVERPYLGPAISAGQATPAQIADIITAIVDSDSIAEPGMKLVAAGDPENSFLMHKIDGTLSCDLLSCAGSDECGNAMPPEQLDLAERDMIRRWIAQGAKP